MWLSCCPGARQTRAQWSKGKRRVRAALNSFLPAGSPGEGSWARPLPPPPLGWHGEDESAKCIQEREHNGINTERRGECVNTSVVGKKWNCNWAFVWCSEAGRAGRHQWIESLTLCQIYQVINLHLLHYFIIQCSRRPAGIELTKRPLRYTAVADAALVRQNLSSIDQLLKIIIIKKLFYWREIFWIRSHDNGCLRHDQIYASYIMNIIFY